MNPKKAINTSNQDCILFIDLEKKPENDRQNSNLLFSKKNNQVFSIENEPFAKQSNLFSQHSHSNRRYSKQSYDESFHLSEKKPHNASVFLKKHLVEEKKFPESLLLDSPQTNSGTGLRLILVRKFINNLKKAAYLRNLPPNAGVLVNDMSYYDHVMPSNKGGLFFFLYLLRNFICWEEKFCIAFKKSLKAKTIHPFGKRKICWDLFLFLNTLFLFFYVPFSIGFEMGSEQNRDIIEKIELFICLVDIFLTLNTSNVENGILIKDRIKICSNYLKTNVLLDILAIFSLVCKDDHFPSSNSEPDHRYVILKMMIYVRTKMFQERYNKIKEYLGLSSKLKGSNKLTILLKKLIILGILSLLVLLCISLLFSHLFACMFHYIAIVSDLQEKTWLKVYSLNYKTKLEQYLYSLYWSTVTMMTVGYGDIVPQNDSEILFTLFTLFIGCIIFGYNISKIGNIFSEMGEDDKKMRYNFEKINQFMESKKINGNLQMRVRAYLKFIWESEKDKLNEELLNIIDSLSDNLKEELYLQGYGEVFKNFPLFADNFSDQFLSNLIKLMKEQTFMKNDIIFKENNQSDHLLYFLISGEIELFHFIDEEHKPISLRRLNEKQATFGEYSFLTGLDHIYSAKALKYTKVYSISRQNFLKVLKEYPNDFEKYCELRDKIKIYGNYQELNLRCILCNKKDHINTNCNLIHYIPNRELIFLKHLFTQDNQRKTVNRKYHKSCSLLQKTQILKRVNEIKALIPVETDDNISMPSMPSESSSFIEENYKEDDEYGDKGLIHIKPIEVVSINEKSKMAFVKLLEKEPDVPLKALKKVPESNSFNSIENEEKEEKKEEKIEKNEVEKVEKIEKAEKIEKLEKDQQDFKEIDRLMEFENYFFEGNVKFFVLKYKRFRNFKKKEMKAKKTMKGPRKFSRLFTGYSLITKKNLDLEENNNMKDQRTVEMKKKDSVGAKKFFSQQRKKWNMLELVTELKSSRKKKNSKKN